MSELSQPAPHMDDDGLRYFKEIADKTQCYLEYGSGGSTAYMANIARVRVVISVESDKQWAEKIKTTIQTTGITVFLEHCDIGGTGDWGTPINRDKVTDFWTYIVAPWKIAKSQRVVPDTILIDGRFRVAIINDGEALPADFNYKKGNSLGLSIVETLVRGDLQGSFTLENAVYDNGIIAIVEFPS